MNEDILRYIQEKNIPYGPFIEEWSRAKGFDNEYLISNYGRVKSFNKKTNKWSLLTHNKSTLYPTLTLKKNGKFRYTLIHRIVAKEFIDGFKDILTINHIDGCKNNNVWLNLECITMADNNRHAIKTKLNEFKKGADNPHYGRALGKCNSSKRILHEPSGKIFESLIEASDFLGMKYRNLSARLRGKVVNNTGMKYIAKEALKES